MTKKTPARRQSQKGFQKKARKMAKKLKIDKKNKTVTAQKSTNKNMRLLFDRLSKSTITRTRQYKNIKDRIPK